MDNGIQGKFWEECSMQREQQVQGPRGADCTCYDKESRESVSLGVPEGRGEPHKRGPTPVEIGVIERE